jgi:hypothetical protein
MMEAMGGKFARNMAKAIPAAKTTVAPKKKKRRGSPKRKRRGPTYRSRRLISFKRTKKRSVFSRFGRLLSRGIRKADKGAESAIILGIAVASGGGIPSAAVAAVATVKKLRDKKERERLKIVAGRAAWRKKQKAKATKAMQKQLLKKIKTESIKRIDQAKPISAFTEEPKMAIHRRTRKWVKTKAGEFLRTSVGYTPVQGGAPPPPPGIGSGVMKPYNPSWQGPTQTGSTLPPGMALSPASNKLGMPMVIEAGTEQRLKCPSGYVAITLPTGARACALRGPAIAAGLWRPRKKPPISAKDYAAMRSIKRVTGKVKTLAKNVGISCTTTRRKR